MRPTLSCIAVLLLASSASAEFVYAYGQLIDCTDCYKTVRVYAVFDDPTDSLLAVGADSSTQPFSFDSDAPLWNDGGGFDGLKQEDFATAPVAGPRDSWVTIGADAAFGNQTDYSPGFIGSNGVHAAVVGSALSEDDGGYFDTDPGTPVTPDGEGRILIAQFTFEPGFNVLNFGGTAYWRPDGGPLVPAPFFVFFVDQKFQCPWDLDLSGEVDFNDLLRLLADWGTCAASCCEADFDNNGMVDFDDLLELLEYWGEPCY